MSSWELALVGGLPAHRMDYGPTLRQVLEVSADGNRLLVIRSVEVDGGDRVDVQFAYDRAVTDQD